MSGYNKKTGNFDLTQTQAYEWCEIPPSSSCTEEDPFERSKCYLELAGLEIVKATATYIRIHATAETVQGILKGMRPR